MYITTMQQVAGLILCMIIAISSPVVLYHYSMQVISRLIALIMHVKFPFLNDVTITVPAHRVGVVKNGPWLTLYLTESVWLHSSFISSRSVLAPKCKVL